MYMGLVVLGRQKYTQSEPSDFEVEVATENLQDTNHQVLIKSQQNCLRHGVEQFSLRFIDLLLPFGIRRNCLRNGRS